MRVKDIVVGRHYAVSPSNYQLERRAKRGLVVASLNRSHWRVRFRNPVVDDGWRFTTDKTSGNYELDLDITYFRSGWDEHIQAAQKRKEQKALLRRESADMQQALETLKALLSARGITLADFEYINTDSRWSGERRSAVAEMSLSFDAVLTIIEALERIDVSQEADVIDELLEENK